MKLNELKIAKDNGLTVAYTTRREGMHEDDYAYEVEIVEVQGTRQVEHYRKGARMGSTKTPGVVVRNVKTGKQDTVPQQHLVATWQEYSEIRTARTQARLARENRQSASLFEAEQAAQALKDRLAADGVEVPYNGVEVAGIGGSSRPYRAPHSYGVRISTDILNHLLSS